MFIAISDSRGYSNLISIQNSCIGTWESRKVVSLVNSANSSCAFKFKKYFFHFNWKWIVNPLLCIDIIGKIPMHVNFHILQMINYNFCYRSIFFWNIVTNYMLVSKWKYFERSTFHSVLPYKNFLTKASSLFFNINTLTQTPCIDKFI